jgi:hypothetical protein
MCTQALYALVSLIEGYLEVSVEGASSHVGEVAADLALELHPQAVQLVQPVRDGLAVVPEIERHTHREVESGHEITGNSNPRNP